MSDTPSAETKIPSPQLLELLREPLNAGCEIQLSIRNGNVWADLGTHAKSSCELEDTPEGVFAHRRYNRHDKVETPEELRELVHNCGHGRNFFSSAWLEIFEQHGMPYPLGSL